MAKKKVAKKKQPTFEESLEELETIVAKLEGGQLGLEQSLQEYEQGVKHLKSCYSLLTAAERRVELVTKVDASGRISSEAFSDDATESLEQKGTSRSRRRSAATKSSGRKPRTEVDDGDSLF